MMLRTMSVWNLGRMKYGEALQVQTKTAHRIKQLLASGKEVIGAILMVEHEPVYTIGLRTKQYSLEDERMLTKLGAEFYRTNRGGLITFHGPGQLVVYPILNLRHFHSSVKWYVCALEKTIIDVCGKYNVIAGTSKVNPGVWVNDRKICAVGVHGSRFVMTHGIALNCSVDLGWFKHIVPCGIEGKFVTSLSQELSTVVTPIDVAPVFIDQFNNHFNCVLEESKTYTNLENIYNCL